MNKINLIIIWKIQNKLNNLNNNFFNMVVKQQKLKIYLLITLRLFKK